MRVALFQLGHEGFHALLPEVLSVPHREVSCGLVACEAVEDSQALVRRGEPIEFLADATAHVGERLFGHVVER